MKNLAVFLTLAVGTLAACLATTGCDALALTDEGYCKAKMKAYAEAFNKEEWGKLEPYYDDKMVWWKGNARKYRGKAAATAWQKSVVSMAQRDGFYVYFHKVSKPKPDQVLMNVTFQVHTVINSMAMVYGNIIWKADVYWVKRGNGKWLLGAIHETSARKKGKPPKS
ncbi:MAG: hypothetical protein KAI66_03645 [Lentisphaeria bacterium]|nr:hypothetical protein [Lentisphaeria bacterium]